MRTINVVNTPAKQGHFNSKILVTADTPQENSSIESEIKVDYKAKTFKLMKELAESEVMLVLFRLSTKKAQPRSGIFKNSSIRPSRNCRKYTLRWGAVILKKRKKKYIN